MSKSRPTTEYTSLADQLRAMIAKQGMTTNALAVAADIPEPVLHRFLSGVRANIRLDTADKLCKFLGVRLTQCHR